MAKKKKVRRKGHDESFEQSLAGLESVVADLEGGELGLEESLARYEDGVQRLKRCHAALEDAQRRIELLSGVDAEGNPVTTPFDHDGSAAETGGDSRSRKRSAKGVDDAEQLF